MEIAILVFFIAIFGGLLFLIGLIWFVFRRVKGSRPQNRNFSGNPNFANNPGHTRHRASALHDSDAGYMAGSMFANQPADQRDWENSGATAQDSSTPTDNSYSHESHGAAAAPAETSDYSSFDSGSSSYDSSSSSTSDLGSSSSDSGSSGSSSD